MNGLDAFERVFDAVLESQQEVARKSALIEDRDATIYALKQQAARDGDAMRDAQAEKLKFEKATCSLWHAAKAVADRGEEGVPALRKVLEDTAGIVDDLPF